MPSIFLTGATGYVGGSVLARLLSHPSISSYKIKTIVRSKEKAEKLNAFGVETVIASYADLDKLEQFSAEADIVIEMVDADNLAAIKAILRGLKKKYEATGEPPIFIHTSGTGVLVDNALGMFAYDTVYDDTDVAQIESLEPTQSHRDVDLAIVDADKEGYTKTYIVLPSTIYGVATGALVDAKIQNPHSIQIPSYIKACLARGQAGTVGEGKNVWPDVHIDDITDLFIVLFDSIITNPSGTAHGREGFYFGENGEHTMLEVYKTTGKALFELGKAKTAEPSPFTEDEIELMPMILYLGTNSRCKGVRSRSIGWKPTKTTQDLLASIKPEVEAILKNQA